MRGALKREDLVLFNVTRIRSVLHYAVQYCLQATIFSSFNMVFYKTTSSLLFHLPSTIIVCPSHMKCQRGMITYLQRLGHLDESKGLTLSRRDKACIMLWLAAVTDLKDVKRFEQRPLVRERSRLFL